MLQKDRWGFVCLEKGKTGEKGEMAKFFSWFYKKSLFSFHLAIQIINLLLLGLYHRIPHLSFSFSRNLKDGMEKEKIEIDPRNHFEFTM
jgi:hypothetical protein